MKILITDGGTTADSLARLFATHDVEVTCDTYGPSRFAKAVGFDRSYQNVLDKRYDLVVANGTYATENRVGRRFLQNDHKNVLWSGDAGIDLEKKHIGRMIFAEAGFDQPLWRYAESPKDAMSYLTDFGNKRIVVKYVAPQKPFRTVMCYNRFEAEAVLQAGDVEPVVLEEWLDGVEFGLTFFWDGKDYLLSVIKFEYKTLGERNLGVMTPQMGCLQFYAPSAAQHHLIDRLLGSPSLLPYLRDYRGSISVNFFLCPDDRVIPVEFTARAGVPDFAVSTVLWQPSFAEFLLSVAQGRMDKHLGEEVHVKNAYAVGVLLAVCGYPYHALFPDICPNVGLIEGLETVTCHSFLSNVKKLGDDIVFTDASVMTLAAQGNTVSEARRHVYDNVRKVVFQDKIYRDDIGVDSDVVIARLIQKRILEV